MISGTERREIARKLREIEWRTMPELTDGEILDLLIASVGFDPCGSEYLDEGFLGRIADLIDRPAIKPEPSGRAYWRCPRCGAFNYRSAVTDCCGVIPAHYCANCGAEVKDEMD